MRLLAQEIKKVFKKRSVFIALILLVTANVYNIVINESDSNEAGDSGYWKVHEQISGEMTDDNIAFVMNNYERLTAIIESGDYETEISSGSFYTGFAFGDQGVFGMHKDEMERIFLFNNEIEKLKNSAKDNMNFYQSVGNSYEAKKSELIYNSYGKRNLNHYYDMSGINKYLNYDFSSLLMIFLLIFVCCPMFTSEKESGMNQLLLSSVHGRQKTVFAKKHAAIIITLIFCALIYASDIACFMSVSHLFGWSVPIYQIKQFSFSPLTIPVWQFALLSLLIKCIGFLIISHIILFFSSLFRETILAFASSLITIMLCVMFYGNSAYDPINPIAFIYNRDFLVNISYANVFGTPVNRFIIVIVFGMVILLLTYLAVHITYMKNSLSVKLFAARRKMES